MRPLVSGEVEAAGIDLNVLAYPPDESMWRMVRNAEFDACELTIATYVRLRARGDADLIALPVFLVRTFPQGGIFVHRDAGIAEPRDLEGKRVGCGEFRMSIAVWARGILQDDHGVDLEAIDWHTARPEEGLDRKVTVLEPGASLAERLAAGELDALIAPRVPPAFLRAGEPVARLFPDARAVEEEYFRRTAIFPILHLVVLKESLYRREPWIASSLYRAFVAAKERCYRDLGETMEGLRVTAPWLDDHLRGVRKLMTDDYWPYGVEANRGALETYVRYLREQGLVDRALAVEELFAPEAADRPVESTRVLVGA